MKRTTADATERIEALESECYILAEELSNAIMLLRDEGRPIEQILLGRVDTLDEEIQRLCNDLRTWAVELEIPDLPDTPAESLRFARQLLERINIAEDNVGQERSAAIAILDQVLTLAHRDDPAFVALAACQQTARQLRSAILAVDTATLHPEARAIVQGQHPFAALVVLVATPEQIDDTVYDKSLAEVENAFGRSLAISLMRKRLALHSASKMSQQDDIPLDTIPVVSAPDGDNRTTMADIASSSSTESDDTQDTQPRLDESTPVSSDTATPRTTLEVPAANGQAADDRWLAEVPRPYLTPTVIPAKENDNRASTLMPGSYVQQIDSAVGQEPGALFVAPVDDNPAESLMPILPEVLETPEAVERSQARQLARQLGNASSNQHDGEIRKLIFLLLIERRMGLAYHLARVYEQTYSDSGSAPASWLVRALTLGPHLQGARTAIAGDLQDTFLYFDLDPQAWGATPEPLAAGLLLMCATLPVALLAPETGAVELLQTLPTDTLPEHSAKLCQIIANFSRSEPPIDTATLNLMNDHAAWQQEWQEMYVDAERYWDEVEHKRLIYDPATDVWQNWTGQRGFISRMIRPILEDDDSRLEDALEATARLTTPQNVKREIDHTDRHVIGRRFGDDIQFKALEQIRSLSREAVNLTRRWERVCEARPSPQLRERLDQIAELRRQVFASLANVREEFNAIKHRYGDSVTIQCVLEWGHAALDRVEDILNNRYQLNVAEPPVHCLLHGPLLRSLKITLDEQWEPGPATPVFAGALIELIAEDDNTWQAVNDAHHAADNHQATAQIVEYLETIEPGSPRVVTLRRRRDLQLNWRRAVLRFLLEKARWETDRAVAYGLVREEESQHYNAVLLSLAQAIDVQLCLSDAHTRLRQLYEEIQRRFTTGIARVQHSLEQAQLPENHPARPWILRALQERDPLTANEYLTLALEGHELPEPTTAGDVFERFFLKDFRGLTDHLSTNGDLWALVQRLREARDAKAAHQIGGVTIWPGPQAFDAARLIEAWYDAKRTLARTAPAGGWKLATIDPVVRSVFDYLGFTTKEVTLLDRASRRLWLTVTTEQIHDKEVCPIRTYGSSAAGRYRLLIVTDRATEEDLVADIADPVKGLPPIIIFYFGRMSEHQRRALAKLCREKHRTCLLIDDTLILLLSEYRPPRLGKLFACTLPFTYLEPYVTTASVVPYEVFYGRRREREEILDPMGSCFIYGGRQIGKTALLRHVEEVAHDPVRGRIVRWIDLKTESIGLKIDIDAIWEVMARELKQFKVIPQNLPPNTSVDRYFEYIENWLRADDNRRILLLLDEADHFLDSDGSHGDKFQRTSRIKGLMDRTNRRFKVVFAGLHNLQRTTRQENNPLAHYGQPRSIGPLLENGEWREARALIERPLICMGYRFESPDLVTRILSQTNYYPSLLQLYGAEMVRYLNEPYRALFPPDSSPPYTITSQHLEAIYRSQELRDGIRHRFRLTLELDPRYEIITYVVAYNALDDEQQILLNGMTIAEIREQSLGWWPQGFVKDPSEQMFLFLLEELFGLGIFRRVNGNRFTLRNANMLLLVGTREQVLTELQRGRELPPGYDAATFRSSFATDPADRSGIARRSPITAKQESDLRNSGHGVTIAFGNAAAGLPVLGTYLRHVLGQGLVVELPTGACEEDFGLALQNLAQRERTGTTLLLVPPETGWGTAWVEQAHKRLSGLTSRTHFARVIFVADPAHIWRLLTQEESSLEQVLANIARPLNLMPWQDAALQQWIIDCAISPSDKDGRTQITQVTGNWPYLLLRYFQRVRDVPSRWQSKLKAMAEEIDVPDQQRDLVTALGLTLEEPVRVLTTMAVLDEGKPIAIADLVYLLAEEISPAVVHQSLRWSDLLSLVTPAGNNQWTLQPLISRVLRSQRQEGIV